MLNSSIINILTAVEATTAEKLHRHRSTQLKCIRASNNALLQQIRISSIISGKVTKSRQEMCRVATHSFSIQNHVGKTMISQIHTVLTSCYNS